MAETISQEIHTYWGELLSLLTFKLRDIDLAEDALQEAILSGLSKWTEGERPENVKGWLYKVAMNKAIDALRHRKMIQGHRPEIIIHTDNSELGPDWIGESIPDERLRMIFTCCHPALNQSSQVELALRTLCGLSTTEIARAFLVPESTMAQRLVRTKRKIRDAGIPFEVPEQGQLKARLQSVLGVIYLIYNEGYNASSGNVPIRQDLCLEARYLTSCVVSLMPDQAEVHGLHALLLLHDARRPARQDESGNLIMLDEQNRDLWDKELIRAGFNSLLSASALNDTGPYQLQAAISAVHSQSTSIKETNWAAIVELYTALQVHAPSSVVALNRAVAVSYMKGPLQGLLEIETLQDSDGLQFYQPYHAAIADMHTRAGHYGRASTAYQRAIELSRNDQERGFLMRQLDKLNQAHH